MMLERILIMGPPTSGKTAAYISIAKFCKDMGKDVKFYVLDSDNSVEFQTDGLDLPIEYRVPYDWPDFNFAFDEWLPKIRPQDFLIVDLIDQPWEMIQKYYVEGVLKIDWDVFHEEYRRSGKKGNPLLEHYSAINQIYTSWESRFLPRNPCNIICCASVKQLSEGGTGQKFKDDQSLINIFLPDGLKASGHTKIAHKFNTILLLTQPTRGKWRISTIRERSPKRENMENEQLNNFASQYMISKAGWRP